MTIKTLEKKDLIPLLLIFAVFKLKFFHVLQVKKKECNNLFH